MTVAQTDALRVVVIDNDSGFVHMLAKRMDDLRWQYRITGGPLPVESLVAMRLNALVIDLTVLGPHAWEYLESVCRRLPGLGVIVCTGPSSVAQRVRGLRAGADDWVTKPAHAEEVLARVEALARRGRRSDARSAVDAVTAGEIEIRADRFQAFARGVSVELTRREFELLQLLASVEGEVLPREDIYQRVWGYAMARGDRSVDVFVRKLRQKLERASPAWRYIHTHFGVGYRFAAEPADGSAAPVAAPADAVDAEDAEDEPEAPDLVTSARFVHA
jgi:DNA-binding response OmpR family regulator